MVTLEMSNQTKNWNGPLQVEHPKMEIYMMMYTTVLFIVYSICMYLHFYSGHYLYRPSMQLSLYLNKGNSNIENFVFIHPKKMYPSQHTCLNLCS